jgi:hypothetical protein
MKCQTKSPEKLMYLSFAVRIHVLKFFLFPNHEPSVISTRWRGMSIICPAHGYFITESAKTSGGESAAGMLSAEDCASLPLELKSDENFMKR